ncbi:MAG TPA: glycosyltransferase family 39 protein [Roseiarcus sp.]|nr:glycosyltransferase family 39 protein [Roseiarcus sp.]
MAKEPGLPLILAFLAAFVTIWTLYFTISDAPAAIHHDSAEAYVWGREFQLGYPKHPPFWAWICGLWFLIFPRAGWAFAILTSLNAGIGLWGAWMLIGNFAEGQKRLAATVLLLLTPFYTFLSYKYNANSIFLSIWPWTLHFFMRAIESRRLADSLLFGVLMSFALLSKYYAVILGGACLLAAVQHPSRFRYFASASPYISVAVAVAICGPHLWWLLTSGAPPMRYFAGEAGRGSGSTAFYAATAFFGAVAQNGVVLFVVAFVSRTSPREWIASFRLKWADPKFRVLTTLALAPLILTVLAAFTVGMKISTNMMISVFSLVPLLAIEIAGPGRLSRTGLQLAAALTLGALALSPAVALGKAWLGTDSVETEPRKELAIEATRLWREKTSLPLSYVAGSFNYYTAVAFYSPDGPHGFDRFDFLRSPWVTPEALAAHGLLAVCESADAECLLLSAKFATPQSTRTEISLAHDFLGHKGEPVRFVVTIIPPRC